MADTKERRKTARSTTTPKSAATPKPDTKAAAPRRRTSAQRAAPLATSNARLDLSAEETRRLIAEAAYFRAKRRGFTPGHELQDWVEAESEVMGRINGSA